MFFVGEGRFSLLHQMIIGRHPICQLFFLVSCLILSEFFPVRLLVCSFSLQTLSLSVVVVLGPGRKSMKFCQLPLEHAGLLINSDPILSFSPVIGYWRPIHSKRLQIREYFLDFCCFLLGYFGGVAERQALGFSTRSGGRRRSQIKTIVYQTELQKELL